MKIACLFAGQGAQYPGMGKSLYEVSGLEEAHRLAATGFGAAVIPESWVNRIKLAA